MSKTLGIAWFWITPRPRPLFTNAIIFNGSTIMILTMIAMMRMTNVDAGDEKDGDQHVG